MTLAPPQQSTLPHDGAPVVRRRRITLERISFFAVFLGIPLAVYLLFVIWPFIQAAYISLTAWNGFSNSMPFVGFENYVTLFQDDTFLRAILNSAILGLVLPLITIVLALSLASVITLGGPGKGPVRGLRGSSFYRVISFFPYVIPAIVVGIMWGMIFDPNAGLMNGFLNAVGVPIGQFPWLGDARTALGTAMFIITWGFVGFYMVLFIAAIKGIPAELFEAARMDGAGRMRTLVQITIPLIRDNIQTAYVYMGIIALDAFVYMSALYASPGGPENSTLVMSQELYFTAFGGIGKFGLATAMGVVLSLVTLAFAGLVFGVNKLTGGSAQNERL